VAVDELYDGPFCVLSAVDNRTFRRLIYEVLDHDPTDADIRQFLERLKTHVQARQKRVWGVTTDGSQLYPEALAAVFPGVPHQVCEFHVIAELTKAILKAVTHVRRELKSQMPKLSRGRPASPEARRQAAHKKRLQQRVQPLFENRHLFVQHQLSSAEQATLKRITRGFPLLRTLRQIMDEVYRLFDRRCRTDTALSRLAGLRTRVARLPKVSRILRKLFTPSIEKALTFLDDSLLPATSNAVERGNRRYRKAQKSVYRVRTRWTIAGRVALDMVRDQRRQAQVRVIRFLHLARAG
jgi:transposase-like protein